MEDFPYCLFSDYFDFKILDLSQNNLSSDRSLEYIFNFIDFFQNCQLLDLSINGLQERQEVWNYIIQMLDKKPNLKIIIYNNPIVSVENKESFEKFTKWNQLIWIQNPNYLNEGIWKNCLGNLINSQETLDIIINTHKDFFESPYRER